MRSGNCNNSSKGREPGTFVERCQSLYPDYKNGARLTTLGCQIAYPENLGFFRRFFGVPDAAGRRLAPCLWGFIMGGGYLARRRHFFLSPPFLWIFFQGRQSGTVGRRMASYQ